MSNNEIYFNGQFLEVETLGPYGEIPSGAKTELHEYWQLTKGKVEGTEKSIEHFLLPVLPGLRRLRKDI
jgi:hypothetical protein